MEVDAAAEGDGEVERMKGIWAASVWINVIGKSRRRESIAFAIGGQSRGFMIVEYRPGYEGVVVGTPMISTGLRLVTMRRWSIYV